MKNRVKTRVQEVLQALGFVQKVQNNTMTNADWDAFNNQYRETHGVTLEDDNNAADDEPPSGTEGVTALPQELINEVTTIATAITTQVESNNGQTTPPATPSLEDNIRTLVTAITNAQRTPESTEPVATVRAQGDVLNRVLGVCGHSQTHVFGIDHDMFNRKHWYNRDMVARQESKQSLTTEDVALFADQFRSYTRSITSRVQELSANNQIGMLDYKQMVAGQFALTYDSLQVNFGSEYLTRRQDMIIAFLRTLKDVSSIFPVRSGIQNGEIIPQAFFGEFSQRYQSGEVFKGSSHITAEIARVSDVMIKYKFDDLIALEKQYIGYLNREGSDVMKWTFIEWLLVSIYKAMFNEQCRRRVIGVLVPIQAGVDNPAMFGADGALRAIQRVEEQHKVLPFKNLKTYSSADIVDYVETFFEEVNKIVPSLDGMKLYINEKHIPWYRQGFRTKYGSDTDYTGAKLQAIDYSLENFVAVPNMDYTDYKMWITVPGNIESLENKPGEMYNIYFERRLEALLAMGRWMEGSAVNMAGMACASESDLEATGRKHQFLFTNFPVTVLAADATTVDASKNTEFITSANTAAKAITAINNAPTDRVIKITCGNTTNATTIAKSGKFAKISAAWAPTAVGDYIKLYAELETTTKTIGDKTVTVTQATGNFLELERKVTS